MTVDEFYIHFASAGMAVQRKYKVPYLSALAQCALETGWGKSKPGNMCFGIKITPSYTGKTQELTTTEYVNGVKQTVKSKFRAYDSIEESFLDYGNFLTVNPRYKNAFNYPNDPYRFCEEVAKAGYATDPNYYSKLKSILDKLKGCEASSSDNSSILLSFGLLAIGGILAYFLK